ncbi:uncharacterized protein LOC114377608 isoform X1 [Glycine soja]|uniref:RING-type domain-containing protein n=1 Tax=Glycine soja TaxID=3848 RepID=A0A0B2REX9_GLYSO|nr:uncharacterized protein LOC114377608 isoform X1 [Glycine soja]XP_028192007.1 uncharacterized protein LOC114377608 isoform X1 [Glycine soja]XP_028192008.1 uncharacterized protein LOC114377608 isoform X1 [Glycine soja]XP_028192009.1 uncharacterized protein LOC114377608 isoform X1 [Glycine soja]XP_028192010.1 uncharacterized protein LOC114377608 isoform X1 [Glycine soja]KHN31870.1 hypothetical protein glysoja_036188 [Glycine soja]RZB84866.1 hypothetical protein D0Y65_032905 [Glycine soja]
MPFASASMAKRSEELGLSLMNTDSANHDRIPGGCHPNDTTAPLPLVSPSPFPHWNLHETSQHYNNEPAGVNSMIDSSQFRSYQNFQMDHNYSHRAEEHNFLPCRPDSRFPCPEGYIGWPYQYDRHNNLAIPSDVRNTSFNLNNFEKPDNGGMCVTPIYGSASRLQMVNPTGTAMSANIGQPSLDMNSGMALCNPNQGCVEPLLTIGKHDERYMTMGSGSNNKESKSSAVTPKFNVTGNSERAFLPPINSYHNHLGSRSSLNPGFDMNDTFSAFQNDSGFISDLAPSGNHEALFDSIPGLRLGPSYAFQWPAAGEQNRYLGQFNRDLGLAGMEFTDVGLTNGLERCMDLNSLPIVGSQTMPFESRQSWANRQLVPSSSGVVTDNLPTEMLPKNNDKFSSQFFSSPPLAVATRSTRGQDLSSNPGQSQAGGSIQQSNSLLRPQSTSDVGIQSGMGYMTAQVSRPSNMSSLKRAASQPLSSTVQNQHRKTLPTQFRHPSIPNWNRLAPSVPNTSRAMSPLIRPAQSLTAQAPPHSVVPPSFPTTWTKSVLQAPNTTRAIHSKMHTATFLAPNDKRISSFHHPSSHTSPRTNQSNHQMLAQALAHQRLKAPIIPSAPRIASNYIKFKDQTAEPSGYKCLLCKRDLSYAPEGPISQPPVPPATAVLPCGHTFHDYCLERITPDDQSKYPPCIPCALLE